VLAVFTDGPVRREFAHASRIENGHAGPAFLIPEEIAYFILALHVRAIVGQQEIVVVTQKRVYERLEQVPVAVGEEP
jgi:hypothetical protein